MYYLPILKEFGKLVIKKTYSFYDVPRTFLVSASVDKKNYLVYWIDETELSDSWFYVCVNDLEIKRLESGAVQLRDFFIFKELIKVTTPFDTQLVSSIEILNIAEVNDDLLPPENYVITQNNGYFSLELDEKYPLKSSVDHEVRIFRERSEKAIEWEPVQKIIGAWNKLYHSIMKNLDFDNATLIPLSSSLGSYKVKFTASNNSELLLNALLLNKALKNDDVKIKDIESLNIDLDIFEELLSTLREYNYNFELRSNSGAQIALFDAKKLSTVENEIIEHNQRFISSELVPQANDISRLIRLIYNTANNIAFNDISEKITLRQVNYYKRAAKLLGLLKENGFTLHPLGWKLAKEDDKTAQLKILAEAFENSVCGWAWMKYCNVEKITDIDPESAPNFLIEKANGLSDDTARRRSTSLISWATEFKKLPPEK